MLQVQDAIVVSDKDEYLKKIMQVRGGERVAPPSRSIDKMTADLLKKVKNYETKHGQMNFESRKKENSSKHDVIPNIAIKKDALISKRRDGWNSKADHSGMIIWEMILNWRSSRVPYITQKLLYKAKPGFGDGLKEAQSMMQLLQRSGGFNKGDVTVIAVAKRGALEAFQNEHGRVIKNKDDLVEFAKYIKTK